MGRKSWGLWDYLLWLGIILILGWALLKSFGIINTPIWVEMLPYFGAGATLIALVFKAGEVSQNIKVMGTDITGLKTKTDTINESLISLSERVALRDETIKKIDEEVREFTNPKK